MVYITVTIDHATAINTVFAGIVGETAVALPVCSETLKGA